MIRVNKSRETPASLLVENCKNYDGQDVKKTLYDDQHGKCYLCEQKTFKSYNIEYYRAKAVGFYPELTFAWINLFLSCPYCNGRKPNAYDILDPTNNDIEEIISHRIDFSNSLILFSNLREGIQEGFTIRLLDILFNGKDQIRDDKTQLLYNDLKTEIEFFLSLLVDNENNKQKIIDSLSIKKEFLAFKYWIIKDNNRLYEEFKGDMTWNKVVS
jgi:uncharacterized protein (TIGR02646 family)